MFSHVIILLTLVEVEVGVGVPVADDVAMGVGKYRFWLDQDLRHEGVTPAVVVAEEVGVGVP